MAYFLRVLVLTRTLAIFRYDFPTISCTFCSIIQSGQWHKLVNYSKTPLLTTQDGSTCVIDVQTIEHKGQKRKLLLTDNGQVFKLKKSRFEETVKPGFV